MKNQELKQYIESRKISNLLGMYRKKVARLEERNKDLSVIIQEDNEGKSPPYVTEQEKKYNKIEYNNNAEFIRVLERVIEDLEDIIIGDV